MVSRNPIKNTFINSTIFETAEDMENRPFQFMTDNLQKRGPADIQDKLYSGYLYQIQVSCFQFSTGFPNASLKTL